MNNETLYAFTEKGAQEIKITVKEIAVQEHLAVAFSNNARRSVNNLVLIDGVYGHAGISIAGGNYQTTSVRIRKLPLRANYADIGSGIMSPAFGHSTCPELNLEWTPPGDMALILVVESSGTAGAFAMGEMYLVAVDTSNLRCYRLPLSNIYNDCKLCHGLRDDVKGMCYMSVWDVVTIACKQFQSSQWNSDLYSSSHGMMSAEWTKAMFRFKPNNSGFEQLTMSGDWRSCSSRISKESLEKSIVIPTL